MAIDLTIQDLLPFAPSVTVEQAEALIAGTLARAAVRAPCILDPAFPSSVAAQDVLLAVILRRFQAAGGRVSETTIGSVTIKYAGELVDGLFAPSEIEELQRMCRVFNGEPSFGPAFSFPAARDWPDPVERC